MPRSPSQRRMFKRSGSVQSPDPLACLLYLVARDWVPPGALEDMLEDALKGSKRDPHTFTNGWLGRHAIDVARRLRRNS